MYSPMSLASAADGVMRSAFGTARAAASAATSTAAIALRPPWASRTGQTTLLTSAPSRSSQRRNACSFVASFDGSDGSAATESAATLSANTAIAIYIVLPQNRRVK